MSSIHDPGRAGEDAFAAERNRMVREQIASRGVRDPRVLAAMAKVPRHRFLPGRLGPEAYGDFPVPIGFGQTISQPYIVAYMVEALGLAPTARVLEIGSGCGYQAAVLAEVAAEVWTIEVRPALAQEAELRLQQLGYGPSRVHVHCGDGTAGWPEAAPFDGIIGAAAATEVPPALLEQLAPAGTLVLPVGDDEQVLWRYRRTAAGFRGEELCAVRFVPMVGSPRPATSGGS
jgi:protein-L-isoaspartate(D-aspartate) O-methyltransferase